MLWKTGLSSLRLATYCHPPPCRRQAQAWTGPWQPERYRNNPVQDFTSRPNATRLYANPVTSKSLSAIPNPKTAGTRIGKREPQGDRSSIGVKAPRSIAKVSTQTVCCAV